MNHIKRFLNQRKILVLLLFLLVISTGLNVYLFFVVINPMQEGKDGEETYAWIGGWGSFMWDFSIKLTPNRAVFSSENHQFNVSVKASYWAPFNFGPHPFYFKIYDKLIYKATLPIDEPPKLAGEKTITANKSKDELHYEIPVFNFTVTLDLNELGIHLFTVVGDIYQNVSLTQWDCAATFAVNLK